MKFSLSSRSVVVPALLCLMGCAPLTVAAQDNGANGPPKILVIEREFTKPGKGGALHEKTEGAFIQALVAAKARPRYLAMTSLSGRNRALFLSGYPSMAAWEEENKSVDSNAALSAALDRANVADGDLLTETNQSVWSRRDDLSLNPGNLHGDRYMEISQYVVKPGHGKEWDELVKLVIEGYKKGVPGANWSMFDMVYGGVDNSGGHAFLVVIPLKSMADADQMISSGKAFAAAMGDEGMKKLAELEASCIESEQTNLFAFSPKLSYPPDQWVKDEPSFWKPKVAAPAKKPETKPAQ